MCKFANQVHQRLIRFAVLRREARHDVAEIGLVELRIFVDLPGKKAFAERTKGNEADPEFLECWDHLRFRFSPPKRVLALERSDGLNFVRAANRLHSGFRKTEVLHLTSLDEFLHRSRNVFDRHVQIDAMLVEEIDGIDLEALERRLGNLLDVLGATI